MKDADKTKRQLLVELAEMRRRLAGVEERHTGHGWPNGESDDGSDSFRRMFFQAPVAILEEDISELRAAMERLKAEGVADFRTYLDQRPDFVYQAAALIKVTNVNEHTLSMYRVHSKDLLMGPPAKVLAPDSMTEFREELIAIAEGQRFFETEAQIRTMAGDVRTMMVRVAIPSTRSPYQTLLVCLVDVTEIRTAAEQVRQTGELFRSVFEGARDCIYIKDRDLKLTHVNPALEALMGCPAVDMIGQTATELYGKDVGKHIREVDLRALAGETVEEEYTRPLYGVPCTFHDIRAPLKDAHGEIIGIFGISRNITERALVEQTSGPTADDYPSEAMRATLFRARYVAATDSVVLLQGESGCGKDFMARYIHSHSKRNRGPFFAINCAALSHELAESELFGHEAGAFTGARGRKRGLLELAEGGTLLLNEIGELSLALQSKLLTFLDTRSFTRVGGEKTVTVDARLVAATHRDLKVEVAEGRFLSPLYYRLDVFCIRVPPLRERIEDIPVLVEQLQKKLAAELHLTQVRPLDKVAMASLAKHSWPGNVRELRNVMERALILPERGRLDLPIPPEDLSYEEWSYNLRFPSEVGLYEIRDQVTRALCEEALRRAHGNKKEAASLLGISRFSFYRYMKFYDIESDDVTED
jgi:PAS domain S-box-containing protein